MNSNCSASQFSLILLILILCSLSLWWVFSYSKKPVLYNEPFEETTYSEETEEINQGSMGPGAMGPGAMGPGSMGPGSMGPGSMGPGSNGCLARVQSGADMPFVNAQTGELLDGPGFESALALGTGDDRILGAEEIPISIPSDYYFLDDGANGEMRIENNITSPSCCGATWPSGIHNKNDPALCGNGPFVPGSRYFGNSTYSSTGCVCVTPKQQQFMYNRGGNGREWF